MTVLILANRAGHDVQRVEEGGDSKLKARIQEFRELMLKRIEERHIQFIGEEASHRWESSTAKTVGVRWANIDMPLDERERRGILEQQKQRTRIPTYVGDRARTALLEDGYQRDVGNGWVEREERLPSDAVREQFMFDKVQENVGDADSVLVICGIIHSMQLAERFRQDGAKVEVEIWPPL